MISEVGATGPTGSSGGTRRDPASRGASGYTERSAQPVVLGSPDDAAVTGVGAPTPSTRNHLAQFKAPNPIWARPCTGAFLTKDPAGAYTLRDAHVGRRACPDLECRRRYRRRVYAQALAGLESLAAYFGVTPKFLTVTLPGDAVNVPLEWLAPRDATLRGNFMKETFTLHYEGRERPVWPDGQAVQTVTLPPWGPLSYKATAGFWNRFVSSVRQHLKKRRNPKHRVFWYFRVVEEQERGAPHYHVLLVAPYVRKAQLQRMATKAGFGFVDIKTAKADVHTQYVSKMAAYASKTAASGGQLPRGQRFYARSRLWGSEAAAALKVAREERRAVRGSQGWEHTWLAPSAVNDYICEHGLAVVDEREQACTVDLATGEVLSATPDHTYG